MREISIQTFNPDDMSDVQGKLWGETLNLSRAISLNPRGTAARIRDGQMVNTYSTRDCSDTEISEFIKSGGSRGSYAHAFISGGPPVDPRYVDRITRQLEDNDPDYGSTSLELLYRPVRRDVLKTGRYIGREVLFLDTKNPHYVANIVRLVDTKEPTNRPIHNASEEALEDFLPGKAFVSVESFTYSAEPGAGIEHRIDPAITWYAQTRELTLDEVLERLNGHLGFIATSVVPESESSGINRPVKVA